MLVGRYDCTTIDDLDARTTLARCFSSYPRHGNYDARMQRQAGERDVNLVTDARVSVPQTLYEIARLVTRAVSDTAATGEVPNSPQGQGDRIPMLYDDASTVIDTDRCSHLATRLIGCYCCHCVSYAANAAGGSVTATVASVSVAITLASYYACVGTLSNVQAFDADLRRCNRLVTIRRMGIPSGGSRLRIRPMASKTADEYAAEFKARKAAMRARMRHNVLNGIVTPGEAAILAQERAEASMAAKGESDEG